MLLYALFIMGIPKHFKDILSFWDVSSLILNPQHPDDSNINGLQGKVRLGMCTFVSFFLMQFCHWKKGDRGRAL